MSSFTCPKCGADILDSPQGYTTGCPHFPLENRTRVHCAPTPDILLAMLAMEEARTEDDDYNEGFNYG